MADVVTDFCSLDNDWHYLALTEDIRVGVRPTVGARLTVEVVSVDDDLGHFEARRIPRRRPNGHSQDVPAA